MNNEDLPTESNNPNITMEHVNTGLVISTLGLLTLLFGSKPEWVGMDRSPVVGFVQITIVLIGLGIMCLGGNIGLGALWGRRQKSILADIGLRLIGTGYVISVFSGMADVFGMTVQKNVKVPFFGPWQAAGLQLGMIIIAAGILILIPYDHISKRKP
jgi:drug/metabolite transporter (DMT)-like permease